MFSKITKYIQEVQIELTKAQWPWSNEEHGIKRFKELWSSSLVVIIAMLLVGGYISFFDFITINVIGFLTKP
ncbi:MAG: preprotein translocase subunit SecE [Chthoniobacterales bacterium]|nr:preprotein translocase subunit SecE [Chthoniobacterales bacterium]